MVRLYYGAKTLYVVLVYTTVPIRKKYVRSAEP